MEFFLAHNANFAGVKGNGENGSITFAIKVHPTNIRPVAKSNLEETEEVCSAVRQQIGPSFKWLLFELSTDDDGDSDDFPNVLYFRIVSTPVTDVLVELFGEDVSIDVQLAIHHMPKTLVFSNLEINTGNSDGGYACEDKNISPAETSLLVTKLSGGGSYEINGILNVTVTSGMPKGPPVKDNMAMNRKMLQEEVGSDVIILSENGKEIRAHKSFLMTHSQVFNAMFQSEMKESRTSIVEMPDVSEESVRALLAYLYCWETTKAKAKPEVAFEMLCAGHKYDIPLLETAMKRLLLAKPDKWFNADVTLKLFSFASKIPIEDGDRLKMKALRVMKGNFESFKDSTTYATMLKEDPETVMELCAHCAT